MGPDTLAPVPDPRGPAIRGGLQHSLVGETRWPRNPRWRHKTSSTRSGPPRLSGPLRSAVLSTYGLSLGRTELFEHDFLPTLLGLGGVRDRGYVAPVTLERKLAETYCALICDAHALAKGAHPSLRVDVIRCRPRHHAKITLIHRQRIVRVIISSANLTHDGCRSQREAAAILDFRPDGGLPPSILSELAREWMETLGNALTDPVRSALDNAVAAAAAWPARAVKGSCPGIRVVFGGPFTALAATGGRLAARGTGPVVEDLFSVLARSRFARDPIRVDRRCAATAWGFAGGNRA